MNKPPYKIRIVFENTNESDYDFRHCTLTHEDGETYLNFASDIDIRLFELTNPSIRCELGLDEKGQPTEDFYIALRIDNSMKIVTDLDGYYVMSNCLECNWNGKFFTMDTDSVTDLMEYAKKLNCNFTITPQGELHITKCDTGA